MSLSKDVNVALWLEWRDFSNKPEVKEAFDFVVVDDDLFTEFKTFKDKYCSCNFILLVVNELLNYWNEHQRKAPAPIRLLYGKPHIQLLQEDLDELCRWVYSCRSKVIWCVCVFVFVCVHVCHVRGFNDCTLRWIGLYIYRCTVYAYPTLMQINVLIG